MINFLGERCVCLKPYQNGSRPYMGRYAGAKSEQKLPETSSTGRYFAGICGNTQVVGGVGQDKAFDRRSVKFIQNVPISSEIYPLEDGNGCCEFCKTMAPDTQLVQFTQWKYRSCYCLKIIPGKLPTTVTRGPLYADICGKAHILYLIKMIKLLKNPQNSQNFKTNKGHFWFSFFELIKI